MSYANIEEHLVQPGHYVGMKFDEGWWFIHVIGTEYEEARPYTLLNSNGNRLAISSNTSGTSDSTANVVDSNDNDILEPDDKFRNTVHQVLFGVSPSRAQIFKLYGRERNNALQDYDEPGELATYVDGFKSPYKYPSPASEFFYINSMADVRLQAYNPTDTSLEVKASFHVNKLRYNTITEVNLMKAMLQGQKRAKLTMMGGGVQNSTQVGIPNWLNEAFGEHIYTTQEILDESNQSTGEDSQQVVPDNTRL